MKKRILVTGGCGFIGSHFVREILDKTDHDIVIIDSLTYAGRVDRVTGGFRLGDTDRVEIRWHDLRAPLPPDESIDWVVNFASESHVDRSISHPIPFFQNNVAVALHMLEFATLSNVEKFIQISTDEVFGPTDGTHQHTEWEPHIPSNPYAASKSAQEAAAIAWWRTYNVPLIILNTMNNFGERQDAEKFVPKCIAAAMTGELLPIHGRFDPESGEFVSGSRVWLHARMFSEAILWTLDNIRPASFLDGATRPTRFNVAGVEQISNLDLADRIGHILERPIYIDAVDFHSSRPGHDMHYGLDGTALREAGWTPSIAFDDCLRTTVLSYVDGGCQNPA